MSKLQDALDNLKHVIERGMDLVDPDAAHREAQVGLLQTLVEEFHKLEARVSAFENQTPTAAPAPATTTTPSGSADETAPAAVGIQ